MQKRGKRRWVLWKPSLHETTIQHCEVKNKASPSPSSTSNVANLLKTPLSANGESEQRRGIAVAMAVTAAAEAAVATAQAAVEIIRLTRPNFILVEQRQAAVVIQTSFRGYLVRNENLFVVRGQKSYTNSGVLGKESTASPEGCRNAAIPHKRI